MWKCALVMAVFLTKLALAQIESGSIVVFSYTKEELGIAADSLGSTPGSSGLHFGMSEPHSSECKIATFRNQLIFASVGSLGYTPHFHLRTDVSTTPQRPFDLTPEWHNNNIAKHVFMRIPLGDDHIGAVSKGWADEVASYWRFLYRLDPATARTAAETEDNAITYGIFAEVDHAAIKVRVAGIRLDPIQDSIIAGIGKAGHCWQCGRENRVCAMGVHLDFVAAFCKGRTAIPRQSTIRTQLVAPAAPNTTLAIEIVERMIDIYGPTYRGIGYPVDAATLDNDGRVTWNAMKKDCDSN